MTVRSPLRPGSLPRRMPDLTAVGHPLRDLASGLVAVAAATAAVASALLDPRMDLGVDLARLQVFDTPDDVAM